MVAAQGSLGDVGGAPRSASGLEDFSEESKLDQGLRFQQETLGPSSSWWGLAILYHRAFSPGALSLFLYLGSQGGGITDEHCDGNLYFSFTPLTRVTMTALVMQLSI